MRVFNLMVLNAFKLSILHGLSVFVNKTGKGNRSTFFPISPRPGFKSWIFSQLPFFKGGEISVSSFHKGEKTSPPFGKGRSGGI
jgi:hypothetical protein